MLAHKERRTTSHSTPAPQRHGAEWRVSIIYADGGEDERVFGMDFTLNVRRAGVIHAAEVPT